MKTKKITIQSDSDLNEIGGLAELLKQGEVVAFPTETVYGLGADIRSETGLSKIFETKGRPSDNPLIVHVDSIAMAESVVENFPEKAKKLAEAFWPGPLTMILPKSKAVSPLVTAGLDTVAVREPDNRVARELIRALKAPIAAPSANISGRPSITKKEDLEREFDGLIAGMIFGEEPQIGIESTVIDLTPEIPVILRPGKISLKELKKIIGEAKLSESILTGEAPEKPASPGMKYKHYAPKAQVVTFDNRNKALDFLKRNSEPQIAVVTLGKEMELGDGIFQVNYGSLEDYTRDIYALFRRMDREGKEIILVEEPGYEDQTVGVLDRLKHASNFEKL